MFEQSFKEYLDKSPDIKTVINWYDLYDGHYVTLKRNFQKKLFSWAIKRAGSYSELARLVGVKRKTISGCSRSLLRPKIETIKKVASFVNYAFDKIANEIIAISNLKPKFPFNLHTKEGAEIRAAFLSDGHIDKNPVKCPQYCPIEKESHTRILHLCRAVFGEFKAKTKWGHKSYVTRFPAVIGTALHLSGVPRGDKRSANCFLPKDICADKALCGSYLRRAFDDEGDINFNRRSIRLTRSIYIDQGKIYPDTIDERKWFPSKLPNLNNLLMGKHLLLQELGIKSKIVSAGIYRAKNGKMSAKWQIDIIQQDNLRKFAREVNFNLSHKQEKLNELLASYKVHERSKGEGQRHALEICTKAYKKKGYFKFGDLGKELVLLGKSYDLAGRYLKTLEQKGMIRKIKRGYYVFTTFTN